MGQLLVVLFFYSHFKLAPPELIPDPDGDARCLVKIMQPTSWIWDQSDQGTWISSDGRNTWNRAGLIPGPLVAIARYAEPMDLGSGYRTEFKVLMGSPR